MKTLCCIGLCLLFAGNGIAQDYETYENYSDEAIAYIRERFKNPENLKESLMHNFELDHFLWPEEIPLYMKTFDITGSRLCAALMEVIKESAEITKWVPLQRNLKDELSKEKNRLLYAILWLGFCADEPAKEFLMEIALDETKGESYRIWAVGACIRAADAQQMKDVLARFLIEKRVLVSTAHRHARVAYEEAGNDAAKRAAIVEALTAAALVREEDRGHFAAADKEFAEVDAEYAKSPRRQAALQLLGLQAEKKSFLKSLWR